MSAVFIGAGTAVVGLGLEVDKSISEANQAKKLQKGLGNPTYQIPKEFEQNREIARQMAQIGLPQQQYNNALNGINQSQAASIAALSNSPNSGAGLAGITRQSDAARGNLNAEDAQAKENNQRYFISQNSAYAQQELDKQQNDVFDKYTRDFNLMQAYKGAADQNMNNAFNGLTQIGGGLMNSGAFNSTSGQTMGDKTGSPTLSATPSTPQFENPLPTQQSIPYYQIAS